MTRDYYHPWVDAGYDPRRQHGGPVERNINRICKKQAAKHEVCLYEGVNVDRIGDRSENDMVRGEKR